MITYLVKQALWLTLVVSAPVVLITMVMGFVLGFLQAVFQLQDQALPFGLKLIVITVVLIAIGPWLTQLMVEFFEQVFTSIEQRQF